MRRIVALMVGCAFVMVANAEQCNAGKKCCSSKKAAVASAEKKSGCSGNAASGNATLVAAEATTASSSGCSTKAKSANLAKACSISARPKMSYKVGDKSTCCSEEARKLAAKGGDLKFVVVGKEYDDRMAATKALATELNGYLSSLTNVKTVAATEAKVCPLSGKTMKEGKAASFQLASYNFCCPKTADKVATKAREAADKVTMKMVVGGKEYTCATSAKTACKEGDKVEYVVGEKKMCCDVMASVELANAKIDAAEKIVAASQPQQPQQAQAGSTENNKG